MQKARKLFYTRDSARKSSATAKMQPRQVASNPNEIISKKKSFRPKSTERNPRSSRGQASAASPSDGDGPQDTQENNWRCHRQSAMPNSQTSELTVARGSVRPFFLHHTSPGAHETTTLLANVVQVEGFPIQDD